MDSSNHAYRCNYICPGLSTCVTPSIRHTPNTQHNLSVPYTQRLISKSLVIFIITHMTTSVSCIIAVYVARTEPILYDIELVANYRQFMARSTTETDTDPHPMTTHGAALAFRVRFLDACRIQLECYVSSRPHNRHFTYQIDRH